jgi:hypothetical protein
MSETWRYIEGYSKYEISDRGRVKNKQGRLLSSFANQRGLVIIGLYVDATQFKQSLAILVATAFPEFANDVSYADLVADGGSPGNYIVHLDGNKSNCNARNLVWRPRHFAVKYHQERRNPPFVEWDRPFLLVQTGERFNHINDCCMKYGLLSYQVYISLQNGGPVYPHKFVFRYL